jgi:hypothetical protein
VLSLRRSDRDGTVQSVYSCTYPCHNDDILSIVPGVDEHRTR